MNVYELLKTDHEKISALFEDLENASDIEARIRLFNQIKNELEAHSDAEKTVFYSRLEEKAEFRDLVQDAIQDHDLVDELLADLDEMDKKSSHWMAKAAILKENIEIHVDEEENGLFPKARRILSDAEAEEMAMQIEQEKNRMRKAG